MTRTPTDPINEDINHIIDTVAHELGHSFGLGDEYEETQREDPLAQESLDEDLPFDNLTRLAAIRCDDFFMLHRKLAADSVKWLSLFRIDVSDKLLQDSETEGGSIKVTIDQRFIGKWVAAKKRALLAYLRRPALDPATGLQLPLKIGDDQSLVRLDIEKVVEANGTILLGGPELPPAVPFPIFPTGSLLFIPKTDASGNLLFVAEKEVLNKLKELTNFEHLPRCGLPLNDPTKPESTDGPDYPIAINGLTPPSPSYKLIGVYEGAIFSHLMYRPAGLCKMRSQHNATDGEFCFVCKYLIVNRVNPALHALLDKKHFPQAKR